MANTYKKTCKKATKKITKFEKKHPMLTGTCAFAWVGCAAFGLISYPIRKVKMHKVIKFWEKAGDEVEDLLVDNNTEATTADASDAAQK